MGTAYNTQIITDGLNLCLDAGNKKSYSPNVFPNPLDIFAWSGGVGGLCTLERDSLAISPAGGIPLKMTSTGNDPFTFTYNALALTLAPAKAGETWKVSGWVKSSIASGYCQVFIFGANSAGNYIEYGYTNTSFTTLGWTRLNASFTFADANTTGIQIRLDGMDGVTGQIIWWDGLQVERGSAATDFSSIPNIQGSKWKDICGVNNHATMYGNVPFETDVVKCFNFATVTGATSAVATLGFSLTSAVNTSTGNYSFETWVKNPSAAAGQCGFFNNTGDASGFRFGITQSYVYFLCGPTYVEANMGYASSFDNAKWHHIVLIFDRNAILDTIPKMYLYLDSVLQNTYNLPTPQTAQLTAVPGLVRSATGGLYTGKLAVLRSYSKALSATEVKHNFNVAKGRFGL